MFLHEGLGCEAMWKSFPARLCAATGCAGLVYDRVGFGQSSPAARARSLHYLHESALCELPKLLEAVLNGRSYILIGHSDGGSISLLHAAEKPDHLIAVVTLAAHVYVENVTLSGIRAAVRAYECGKLKGLSDYHGRNADRVFRAWQTIWLSPDFRSWNIEYALDSVGVPVLVIQGDDDQYATRQHAADIAEGIGENAKLIMLSGCGHSPHLDDPEAVIEQIEAFITKNPH